MSEYTKQAADFLKKAGARMTISYAETVTGFPFSKGDHHEHNKYIVRINRAGKSYSFPFYDSAVNTWSGKRPTAYDVLACVQSYNPGDFWDFVDEYGYEVHGREDYERTHQVWGECWKQYKKLRRIFGDELMEDLQEIR